jgi:predicted amidohydrolase
MDKIRVCLLKVMPAKGDLEGNMRKLESILQTVPVPSVDVIITPECYLDGYVSTEDHVDRQSLAKYSVPDNSPYLQRAARMAREHNCWLIFGCTHHTPQGSKNAAFVFDRQGQVVGRYYKLHLQGTDVKYVAGDALPIFDSDFGRFGVMICADRRWPETVRTLALKGARVILNPTYGMHGEHNLRMMRVRSYESEVYICFAHPLQSLITNPKGEVEAMLVSSLDHYLIHDLDLNVAEQVRSRDSAHLRDRRADVYEPGL